MPFQAAEPVTGMTANAMPNMLKAETCALFSNSSTLSIYPYIWKSI